MKYLKKVMCLVLCLFSVFAFVACGSKNDNGEGSENNRPTSTEKSINDLLLEVHKKLDEETKTQSDLYPSFSALTDKNEYEYKLYNDFVYEGIYLLKMLSEETALKNKLWLAGDESSSELIKGDANKLEMLYVTREKKDYLNNIEIYMLFSKKDYNFAENPKSFNMFCYEIEYDEKSKYLNISFYLEKSLTSRNIADSNANYYMFSYESDKMNAGANYLQARKFYRLQEFDFENIYGDFSEIRDYNYVVFECSSNTKVISNELGVVGKTEDKESIRDVLLKFDEIERKIKDVQASKKQISKLTDKFILIANANNISDFIK